jgi:linoleoyl-CoA desaturase
MSHQAPTFASQNQSAFYSTLRQRINQYFSDLNIPKTGNYHLYIKAVILFALYILPFVAIFVFDLSIFWTLACYFLMGAGKAGLGFNVMHDSNHGSFSEKKWLNNLFSYTMDMVGGNAVAWKIQHNILHHTYTNVYGHDEDIHDKPFLRLSPEGKWSKYHKFQHYYAILLYGMATLSWVSVKDFRQMAIYRKEGLLEKIGVKPTAVYINLVIGKVLYLFAFIALPLIIGHHSWYIYIIGFFIMHFVAGLITTLVFQLAHVVEETDFIKPDEENHLENSWAIHQLLTTSNFAPKNSILGWYIGGLNYQIEHHLFPQISHVHYAGIAPIVRKTALEFNIPYYQTETFMAAVVSHWKMLRQLGRQEAMVRA